ncbi:cytosolic carboxypeptidase 1-like isoform X1 [Clavelina lepadiformis]|uniref:cytosolic carboxypeptidase 1-like isoform X1 n=1 Tax=Clavelina lepadiformis TaxID=159417 RepID=UPI004041482D
MFAVKSAKSHSHTKSRAKSVLSTLERLSGASNPDKEQTRYLCHKLLQLVNDQETCKKDATSKAGLDIILLTLESCSDQASCLALVSTLAEISNGGHSAIKRLISHDATRVLLHTLSYLGSHLDWRLLSAIIHLLSKIGPKDRKFALRARLTGSLSMILTSVRSSHNHTNHSRLLPASLAVLKLSVFNSSTNASLLGRAGAIHVLQRVIASLSRKQPIPLKTALATLNLLVRLSKVNASRAVNVGLVSQLLQMHQDYHRRDFKHNRHAAIRKSILNSIKNVVVLRGGRKAFFDCNGMLLLYNSCQDYLAVGCTNKAVESLLLVATMIIRRCQTKSKLPISNSRCTFQFVLPGTRERSDSLDSFDYLGSDDGDEFDEATETVSNNEDESQSESTSSNRRGSTTSASKGSASSNGSREPLKPKVTRTHEDLKMYESFFPELQEFPLSKHVDDVNGLNRPHTSGEAEAHSSRKNLPVRHSLPDLTHLSPHLQHIRQQETCNPWEFQYDIANTFQSMKLDHSEKGLNSVEGSPTKLMTKSSPRKSPNGFSVNYSSGDDVKMGVQRSPTSAWPSMRPDDTVLSGRFVTLPNIITGGLQNQPGKNSSSSFQDFDLTTEQQEIVDFIQTLAERTKSVKTQVNRLSDADAYGSFPVPRLESQVNKRYVQRLIKAKVLEDVARNLFPDNTINEVVFSSESALLPDDTKMCFEDVKFFKGDVQDPKDLTDGASCSKTETDFSYLPPVQILDQIKELSESGAATQNEANLNTPIPILYDNSEHPEVKKGHAMDSSTTLSDGTWQDSDKAQDLALEEDEQDAKLLNKLANPSRPNSFKGDLSLPLNFYSGFECGNLRTAVRIREYEYDLVLNPDCNSNHHFQWFYFSVSNMKTSQPYRFNIINCEKKGSLINEGMQPVMFSMAEARAGRPHWFRVGRETCYYRNHFLRSHLSAGGVKGRTYFTLTFTMTFQHLNDICYFAYHYPYPYTKLQLDLQHFLSGIDPSTMYVRNQTFCHTLAGNPLPLLTITAMPKADDVCSTKQAIEDMRSRPYIFLSARVHPGETNASWTMRGTLRLLLTPPPNSESDHDEETTALAAIADELRRSYIFKIVPMLNPDGVINGHHRCSLSGCDLNRTWLDPDAELHPTIYHTKGLLQYLESIQKAPLIYCDYHGHSRKMNVFLYGCSHRESIAAGEAATVQDGPEDAGYKTLPRLLSHLAPTFSMKNCNFVVEKSKAATARVVVWKDIGVTRSYTMESTYCGCDQGAFKGKQIGTRELEGMGSKFCEVLLHLKAKNKTRGLPVFDLDDEPIDTADPTSQSLNNDNDEDSGPGCPANSDAELTPDDDISYLDQAYDVISGPYDGSSFLYHYVRSRSEQPCASKTDMAFWRYDPDNPPELTPQLRPFTVNQVNLTPNTGKSNANEPATFSGFRREPSKHSLKQNPVAATHSLRMSQKSSSLKIEIPSDDGFRSCLKTSPISPRSKPLPVIKAKVSPFTGRVLSYEYGDEDEVPTAPRPFESGLVLRKSPGHYLGSHKTG